MPWSRTGPNAITIATGSPGGTYHAYGEGLARLLTRTLGIRVAAMETDGPSENIKLIEDGAAQIGFVTMGVAQQAWNGVGDWQGVAPRRNARAAFPMYDTPFHFIVPTRLPDPEHRRFGRQAARRGALGGK